MTATANTAQYIPWQLLHRIVNNQNLSYHKEPSQLWKIAQLTYQFQIKYIFVVLTFFLNRFTQ